jgi:hypothetical protein
MTVPEATLTTASAQTDILYSDIFSTAATAWKSNHAMADSVELQFHHLLSAVSVTVKNCMASALTVQSVTVTLPNKAGATVDFSGTTVAPAVTDLVADGAFGGITSETTIAAEAVVDVLNPTNDMTVDGAKASPFMIWPQTLAEDAAKITLVFSNNRSRTVSIPADTQWEAGNIYTYDIKIYPDEIKLIFKVQPWEKETFTLDTKDDSINMSNVTWMNARLVVDGSIVNTLDNNAFSVYMFYKPSLPGPDDDPSSATPYTAFDYYPAQGYFTVNYPNAGLFKIELIPAYGQTEEDLDASKYEIWIYDNSLNPSAFRAINPDGENITNDTVYFQVRAAAGQDGAQHKAQINIWFKPDGQDEWISAYSEIRANYALVIPATS